MIQLDLFDYEIDYKKEFLELEHKFRKLELEMERSRKSQFAKIGACMKLYTELAHELQILKLNICKGKIVV
ncbi:hypothetical protein SBF1_6930003 [Candidatus Desulfosporosinus infrequens]|uniref:Uncharacterized protein n=1 Tax=Candidatus Desulfosporosinus infrequens TaxID=2043169 RepID=A0A2U3LP31_9FIRM|nr:hypothetical protein SBF1_6930003 [Candidatus Desulfosporosinus infrequens]